MKKDQFYNIFFNSDFLEAQIENGGLVDEQIVRLLIKNKVVKLPFGIAVGMNSSELEDIFGEADVSDETQIEYHIGYGFIAILHFEIENGKVKRIIYTEEI